MEEPVSDKEWRARWDAQTLSEAEVIKADQARLDAAKTAATKLADEKGKEKVAMDKVARTGGKGKPANTATGTGKPEFSPPRGGTGKKATNYNVFQKLSKG